MASFTRLISAVDTHTAGEPTRIVLSGLPPIPGRTMAEKKRYMIDNLDHLRTFLMREPRGHRDMVGAILTPPTTEEAQYGIIFIDHEGYLDMCGHGTMGITTALIELGIVPAAEPEAIVCFDTPAGLVQGRARIEQGRVAEVAVSNVPSFLYASDVPLDLPEIGAVSIDISFGGNFFALVSAQALGVSIQPDNVARLIHLGLLIKRAANEKLRVQHPLQKHIRAVELTEIYEKPDPTRPYARNVVVFGEGQVDRSPCGTGTSAAMAMLYSRGKLGLNEEFVNESIIGTRFRGRLVEESRIGSFVAVAPVIAGQAYITGFQQLVSDPSDPLQHGFVIG